MICHASTVRSRPLAGMVLSGMISLFGLIGCEQTPPEPQVPRAAAVASPPRIEAAQLGETRNVHRFEDVWLCSQPPAEELATLRDQGVKTIINLRPASETPDFNQRQAVTELGMAYHNPAFGSADELTDAVLDEALAVLADERNHPAAVYCASANRVGAIWLAHRVVNDDIPFDAALEEAREVGLRSDGYIERVKAYIASER